MSSASRSATFCSVCESAARPHTCRASDDSPGQPFGHMHATWPNDLPSMMLVARLKGGDRTSCSYCKFLPGCMTWKNETCPVAQFCEQKPLVGQEAPCSMSGDACLKKCAVLMSSIQGGACHEAEPWSSTHWISHVPRLRHAYMQEIHAATHYSRFEINKSPSALLCKASCRSISATSSAI